jgi:hypothetical protein
MFKITTNSLVNSFIYMATSFDPKLGYQQAITYELETYTETKSRSFSVLFKVLCYDLTMARV